MKKKLVIVLLSVAALTGCSERKQTDMPPQPSWIKTVSPTGREVECLWIGDYGGLAANSYQADNWCWEITND